MTNVTSVGVGASGVIYFTVGSGSASSAPPGLRSFTESTNSFMMLGPTSLIAATAFVGNASDPFSWLWAGELGLGWNIYLNTNATAVAMVTNIPQLASDTENAYFIVDTQIFKLPFTGGGATSTYQIPATDSGTADPVNIVSDGDPTGYFFWTEEGTTLKEASKSSTTSSPMFVGTVSSNAGSVVADGAHVYWVDASGTLFSQLEGVTGVPEPVESGLDCAGTLAQDATHLYYSAGCSPNVRVFQLMKP
jgi:hypothetical protein